MCVCVCVLMYVCNVCICVNVCVWQNEIIVYDHNAGRLNEIKTNHMHSIFKPCMLYVSTMPPMGRISPLLEDTTSHRRMLFFKHNHQLRHRLSCVQAKRPDPAMPNT